MRRLLCLAVLADAAAKFALEKKGQKVLNVKLYETGYTFTIELRLDPETGVLSPDSNAAQTSIAPRYPCQEIPTNFSGSSTTRGAETKDVEAVVRQPRRGGRAAHREAAEPVL